MLHVFTLMTNHQKLVHFYTSANDENIVHLIKLEFKQNKLYFYQYRDSTLIYILNNINVIRNITDKEIIRGFFLCFLLFNKNNKNCRNLINI